MPELGGLAQIRQLFEQLQRRRFPVSVDDLDAVRMALTAGFGWESVADLESVLVALWAKSPREASVLRSLFAQFSWPKGWTADALPQEAVPSIQVPDVASTDGTPAAPVADEAAHEATAAPDEMRGIGRLPPLSLQGVRISDAKLVLEEQFALTHREVAQAFRRLRKPVRVGVPTELDIDGTILRRLEAAIPVMPHLVPRRRNSFRLALLVDVGGSMQPFEPYVEAVCEAISEDSRLLATSTFYFHDVPGQGSDRALLEDLPRNEFFPVFDNILGRLPADDQGFVYRDRDLIESVPLRDALSTLAPGTAILVVSDAGAARSRVDLERVLDTLAFVKALRQRGGGVAWANPCPREFWRNTVASQIARHVPMCTLDVAGLLPLVNALRGQPSHLERAL